MIEEKLVHKQAQEIERLIQEVEAITEPGLREKIFTPFFTTREKGTGLGLAFVREIIGDHGGIVQVGDAPGGGARFWFDLDAGREIK